LAGASFQPDCSTPCDADAQYAEHPPNGWRVVCELVRDDDAWLDAALTVEYPMQESLSGSLIASLLDQDVQYDTVLIDGSPQPMAFATDLQRHLV
jgi:hypothetical protein